jgi:hypothetical protein
MPIVSMVLSVRVVSVVSIREPFSCFLLCSDHLLYCASEFFIVSQVLFAKVLKLSLGHDPVGEGFDYFSFSDVVYLSTQFTKSSVIISEALATFLFESLQFCMGDRVRDDACEIFTKGSLQVLPSPN